MRLNLFLLFSILYTLFIVNNNVYGQCDVAISSWDTTTGDIVINLTSMPVEERGMVNTLRVSEIY